VGDTGVMVVGEPSVVEVVGVDVSKGVTVLDNVEFLSAKVLFEQF